MRAGSESGRVIVFFIIVLLFIIIAATWKLFWPGIRQSLPVDSGLVNIVDAEPSPAPTPSASVVVAAVQVLPSVLPSPSQSVSPVPAPVPAPSPLTIAFVRDKKGNVISLSGVEAVLKWASENRFDKESGFTADAIAMSSRTGGAIYLVQSRESLVKSIVDAINHMKARISGSTGDLEIAFLIDYSGSMRRYIEEVIGGLGEINETIKPEVVAGRAVRLAVITFGSPKRSKIELELSKNPADFKTTLERLLSEFRQKNHAADPGEASFAAIDLGTKRLKWNTYHRQMIIITDEPSYELRVIDEYKNFSDRQREETRQFVESVYRNLGGIALYPILLKGGMGWDRR